MKAALVVMSILGCNDAGTTCIPVAQVPDQWQTIAACDAASEKHLARYTNVDHPMIVAVCQTADTTALEDSTEDFETASRPVAPVPPSDAEQRRGIAARAVDLVRGVIPTGQGLRDTVRYPVHVVTDTYSWMARRITD